MQDAKSNISGLLAASMVALLLFASPAYAHEGHAHKYMGTISSVRNGQLHVTTTEGKQVTFTVGAKTEIIRGNTKARTADLTEGTRVVVDATGDKEPFAAKRIRLGTPEK